MEAVYYLEMSIWLAVAAFGFGILFNVPKRTLGMIALLAALGGSCKLILMYCGVHIIISSFIGAAVIGLLSIQTAHSKHAPPLVFSIPAVIPMVPGAFAYKAMLGFIKLTGDVQQPVYEIALKESINNSILAAFIVLSLTAGVSFPLLISRKDSAKHIKYIKK